MKANRIAPTGTPHFAASHLGLFCLAMSVKRLQAVKIENLTFSNLLKYRVWVLVLTSTIICVLEQQ